MIKFISNYDSLINETYDSSFETFLYNNFELILDCLNQDFEYCEMSLSNFKKHLIQLYNTEDELFFKYITKSISTKIGLEDYFHPLVSYNHAYKEWREYNKDKDESAFYNEIPYAFLSEVKVFGFKTKGILCIFHLGGDDYKFFNTFQIEDGNLETQLSMIIHSIQIDNQ